MTNRAVLSLGRFCSAFVLMDQWRSSSSFISSLLLTRFIGTFGCTATTVTGELIKGPAYVSRNGENAIAAGTNSTTNPDTVTARGRGAVIRSTAAALSATIRKLTA